MEICGRVAELLDTRSASLLAGCCGLSLTAVLLAYGPTPFAKVDTLEPSSFAGVEAGGIPNAPVNSIEQTGGGLLSETRAVSGAGPEFRESSSATRTDPSSTATRGFLVRVGVFGDPSNAERVVEYLRGEKPRRECCDHSQ